MEERSKISIIGTPITFGLISTLVERYLVQPYANLTQKTQAAWYSSVWYLNSVMIWVNLSRRSNNYYNQQT